MRSSLEAQVAPNLENGFKNYGSYDGSRLDTVNLMNGNLMLHAPLLPGIPQRGAASLQETLFIAPRFVLDSQRKPLWPEPYDIQELI
jgi:hypothetical protein